MPGSKLTNQSLVSSLCALHSICSQFILYRVVFSGSFSAGFSGTSVKGLKSYLSVCVLSDARYMLFKLVVKGM